MRYEDLVEHSTYANETYYHAITADMRKKNTLVRIETDDYKPFWAVTKHADIIEVERQNALFTNTLNSVLETKETEATLDETGPWLKTLIHMDEPEHSAFRLLTREWFLPQNLKKIEPEIKEIAYDVITQMLEKGPEIDFVKDVAVWFPLKVIMMILGIPEKDEALMLKLTQELLGDNDPEMQRVASEKNNTIMTIADYFSYFTEITKDRREKPSRDVASVIANGTVDGRDLTELETVSYYVIIATAGHDTTSSASAGGLLAMLEHPEELKRVMTGEVDLALTAEEAIRWTSPVKHFMRYATQDYEIRNTKISKNDALMMLYPSGNRDEEVFDLPFDFIADRRPNRHLAFGHGAHHCLGNILAKLEMKFLYQELFHRINHIEIIGQPRMVESNFVTGLKSLPVRIKAR
ncbi:MAG: cytochrome P450 [Gammaproteobacteria bacterium]|nr:cytochrome P450 [Gammaproteobacteria bacterium]